MTDIAPELLKKVQKSFETETAGLKEKIAKGVKNYEEAYRYAIKTGIALSVAFGTNITSEILPDGMMYYNIASRVILPMLRAEHEISSAAAAQAQKSVNKAAGIGMKPQVAEFDEEKAQGIIDRVSSEPFEDISWILDEPVKTFSKNAVDDTLQKNVEFQGKSGLSPKIVRTADANACEWCQELAGTYEYPNVPDDVYRRHANCNCIVEYVEGGKIQNIHTKHTRERKNYDIIQKHPMLSGHVRFKTGDLSPEQYILAKDLWRKYEEQEIPYERGKEALFEEFDNNLTDEEKESCIIHKAVDGYKYTAIHLGHNEYKVIRVDPIDRDPIEEEMRKLFGSEYEKYFSW